MGWDGTEWIAISGASGLTSDTSMLEWLVRAVRSAWEVKMSLIPSLGRIFSS